MRLRHITRCLLFIPLFILSLASLGYNSRAAMAREGKRPPLPAIRANIDKLNEKSSNEGHHGQLAEIYARRSNPSIRPSRFGLYSPQRPGIHEPLVAEEPSVNQLNSQYSFDRLYNGNQFINFLVVATILRQFVDTLADQKSSSKADVPTGSSSPIKGSNVKGKGQVSGSSGLEQDIPESSRETTVKKRSTDDGTVTRESPVWVEFEPWLGSWIKINKGDQFVATHNFNFHRFKIERWKIGSVVKIDMEESVVPDKFVTKSVILEFPTDLFISGWGFSEPVEEIDATRPTPFPISPFLLLPQENPKKTEVRSSNFKWDGNNPVEKLVREGIRLKKR